MWLDRAARYAQRITILLSRSAFAIGAGVLALMMVFQSADVVLRYFFSRPVTGSIELTEFMMVVVIFFGVVHTQLHGGHINVDLVISRLSARVQAVVNSVTTFATLGIFALISWQSIIFAQSLEASQRSSASWHIPLHPFAYLVAVGSALLSIVLIGNLSNQLTQAIKGAKRLAQLGLFLVILLACVLLAAPVWGRGLWEVSPFTFGIFFICFLIVITFSGMSIGAVMALVGFLGLVYLTGPGAGLSRTAVAAYTTSATYSNSMIPLFILMGAFCFHAGLSQNLYLTAYKWLGRLPGGLAMATVGACAGFAAVSGSSVATAVTMGTVALPEMKGYKYDSALATGCVAAGGTLGILIPPSVPLVIYGILTEQSIGKLFLAGFLPGILQAISYMITIYFL